MNITNGLMNRNLNMKNLIDILVAIGIIACGYFLICLCAIAQQCFTI